MQLFHRSFFAMNTRMNIVMHQAEVHAMEAAYSQIKQETLQWEMVMSRFHPVAEVTGLNDTLAEQSEAIISLPLAEILHGCRSLKIRTKGYFDVAYLSSSALRDFTVDTTTGKLQAEEPGLCIDLGAIGKGIALQRIGEVLHQHSIAHALVSFGESSVLTRGLHPAGSPWPIAFAESVDEANVFHLQDDALSISGLHDGVGHIRNPTSREVLQRSETIGIRAACPIEAEALSTALYIAPKQEHEEILAGFEVGEDRFG